MKVRLQLEPEQRADAAVRRLLRRYWEDFRRNEGAVRKGKAGEYLHDYRVAARRSRALLKQTEDLFPARSIACYRREFAWLGGLTGPVRDLELFVDAIRAFEAGEGREIKGAELAPACEILNRRMALAEARLLKALNGARYRRLTEGWQGFLQRSPASRPRSPYAARPVGEIAGRRIRAVLDKLARQARHLDGKISDKRLHKLRIRLKTLRYLAESFAGLYDAEPLGKVVDTTKKMQDVLGEFQDLVVHRLMLDELARERLPDETLKAIGLMDKALNKRQRKVRAEAVRRYRKFCTQKNIRRLNALFG